jgi:hypothetical protein
MARRPHPVPHVPRKVMQVIVILLAGAVWLTLVIVVVALCASAAMGDGRPAAPPQSIVLVMRSTSAIEVSPSRTF